MNTRIYAHRGASGYAPENTLEAFALAAKMGADGVELDVHLSLDGELIVTHDERIDRVSDGSGLVRDMTLAQLKRFHFNKTFPEYKDARVPTLREVYELLEPTGLHVNVELKTNLFDYPGIEEKCVALARETGMEARVLYSSFNHHSLLRVKAIDASLPCGILYDNVMVRPWEYAKGLGLNALHMHYSELRIAGAVQAAHAAGLLVDPWTVNDEDMMRECARLGVDIMITNYPDKARQVALAANAGM